MTHSCDKCERKGLSLLVALYAAAPKELAAKLTAPGGHFGQGVIDKALKESAYYLRSMEPGYLYLLYPNKLWRGYLIDSAGYPRYYPNLAYEDMPSVIDADSLVVACARQGTSHTGVEAICIENPDKLKGPVYIAYSRHKWTKAVRAHYAAAPEPRMQKIAAFDGSAFPHAEVASEAAIQHWIADYNPAAVAALNKTLPDDAKLADRSASTAGLAKAMLAHSGKLAKPGLIMALHDPIGITATLNDHRNTLVQEVMGLDAKSTPAEQDDFVVVAAIESLHKNIVESKADWPRHEKHINLTKYNATKEKWEKRMALGKKLEARSADYVAWMDSPSTKDIFRHDFDPADPLSGCALEAWFVACTQGSGITMLERDKIWEPWFNAEPDSEDNLVWKAATANDKNLLALLLTSKIDKTFKIEKSTFGAFKRTEWYNNLHAVYVAGTSKGRAYSDTTEALAKTLGGQLLWLQKRNPKQYMRSMAQLASVLLARGDLVILPEPMSTPLRSFTRMAQEAIIGKPNVRIPLTASYAKGSYVRPRIIKPADIPKEEVRELVKSLDGALMLDLSGKNSTVAFTAWVVSKLEPGKPLDPSVDAVFKRLKLDRQAFVVPEKFDFNPFSSAARDVRTAKFFDRPLSVIGGMFALLSFCNASNAIVDELKKGKGADEEKLWKGYVGLATGVASGLASALEITAATKIIANKGVKTAATRLLGLGAAGISLATGLTDAYLNWRAADKLSSEGDDDAALAGYWATGTGVFGSLFAFAAAVGIYNSWNPAGIVILIVVGVGLVGGSIYNAIDSDKKKDTPLEKWLDRCRLGKQVLPSSKPPFKDLDAEMTALRAIIYAVRLESQSYHDNAILKIFYSVAVPLYTKDSEVIVRLFGTDPDGLERQLKQATFRAASTHAADTKESLALPVDEVEPKIEGQSLLLKGEALVRTPPMGLGRDPRTGRWVIPVGSQLKDVSNVPYFSRLRVAVHYKPDMQTWPAFELEASA